MKLAFSRHMKSSALIRRPQRTPYEGIWEAAGAGLQVEQAPGRVLPGLLPFEDPAAPRPIPKLLYIEDNTENMLLMKRVMRMRPAIQLLEAVAGLPGLALARDQTPALVVLDLNLPDINGDEVLRQLLADPRTAAIPVLILSGDCRPEHIKRLLAAGAREYLTKPFLLTEFLSVVDELLKANTPPPGLSLAS